MASGHVRYQTDGTCTLSTTPVSSNYRNQLGGTFTYDASGDLTYDGTNTLTYDAEGRIATSTASGSTTTYVNGADVQRIGKIQGGVETNYARSIDGSLLATYVGGTFNGYPQEMWVGGKHFGTVTGASSSNSVLSYNSSNQLSGVTPPGGSSPSPSPLSYDAAGNVVSDNGSGNTYLYDGEGRVCAVASSGPTGGVLLTGYIYDADGTRVAKGTIQRWGTCDPSTNGFQPMTDYILGPGGEQLTEMAMDENGQMAWKHTNVWAAGKLLATYDLDGLHYHLTDWLGTRRAQTDSGGAIEDACASLPYGDALSCIGPTFTTEHHFTGKERDTESGNDYFGERYYASTMGRFMSPDQGPWKLDDPQYFNMYGYALNNPLRYGDDEGDTAQDRVNKANQLATQNIPYVHGGGHPGNPNASCGLDCSGLVRAVFRADPDNTLKVNGSAAGEAGQFEAGGQYSTNIGDAQPGDAIFFTDSSGTIVHTGIVVDIRDGKIYFVHAPRPGKNVQRFYIKINDPRLGGEKFAGVGRSNEAGSHPAAQKGPGLWQRIVTWFGSLFGNDDSHPDPEGHPKRHTGPDPPPLKHRDGTSDGGE